MQEGSEKGKVEIKFPTGSGLGEGSVREIEGDPPDAEVVGGFSQIEIPARERK